MVKGMLGGELGPAEVLGHQGRKESTSHRVQAVEIFQQGTTSAPASPAVLPMSEIHANTEFHLQEGQQSL